MRELENGGESRQRGGGGCCLPPHSESGQVFQRIAERHLPFEYAPRPSPPFPRLRLRRRGRNQQLQGPPAWIAIREIYVVILVFLRIPNGGDCQEDGRRESSCRILEDLVLVSLSPSNSILAIQSGFNMSFRNFACLINRELFLVRRYSMEVKALFKRLGVEPLVIELDELGEASLILVCFSSNQLFSFPSVADK